MEMTFDTFLKNKGPGYIFAAAASEPEVNERGTSLNARNCGYAQVEDLGCARVVVMREWENLGCAAYQSHV